MRVNIGLHFIVSVFMWLMSWTAAIDIVYEDLNNLNKSSMPNGFVNLTSTTDNNYDFDTTPIPDEPSPNIVDVDLFNKSSTSNGYVNVTSTTDINFDINNTTIPDVSPPDIIDVGLINRTETELICTENFTFYGNHWANHCYNDRHCKRYGDCCRDSEYYVESEQTANFEGGGHVFNNSRYGCYSININGTVKHMLMIGRCPLGAWTEFDIRDKCENGNGSLATTYPVTGNDTGHTYKNVYCAWCNGERQSVAYWKPVFRCPNPDNDNQCEIELVPPAQAVPPRSCYPTTIVDGCPAGTPDAQTRSCASYAYTVFAGPHSANGHAFRNVDCARCNGVSTIHGLRCTPRSLTTITTWSTTRLGFNPRMKLDSCSSDELYNVEADRCDSPFRDSIRTSACWTTVTVGRAVYDAKSMDNNTVFVYPYNKRLQYQRQNAEAGTVDSGILNVCTGYADGLVKKIYPEWVLLVGTLFDLVSMIALIVHLVMFFLRAKPSNLFEKNLACLATSLLLSIFVLHIWGRLVTAGTNLPCLLHALALQFSFLAVFVWMFIISVDVWFMLHSSTTKLRVASGKQTARFSAYSAFGWLVPASFTAFAAILEMSTLLPKFKPNFQYKCWYGNLLSLFVFVWIPACTTIIANCLLFVCTVLIVIKSRNYFRSSPSTDTVTSAAVSQFRKNLRIYIRLAIMMGLPWVFSLINSVVDNIVCKILGVFFNELQGFYLFLAFGCNWTKVCSIFTKSPAVTSSGSRSDVESTITTV